MGGAVGNTERIREEKTNSVDHEHVFRRSW